MRVYVGTSGWVYSWNPNGLAWYVEHSGLTTVELNMSFYRLPGERQVKSWLRHTERSGLRWSVKVSRVVTHMCRLSEKSYRHMMRVLEVFKPLDPYIDFYLLQLPPSYVAGEAAARRLEAFASEFNLGWRLAVEFRDASWLSDEWVSWARERGLTYVSVDSPDFVFYGRSGPYTYVRFHGRTVWYGHRYSAEELREAARRLLALGGEALYAYFNNNHDMLDNARMFAEIVRGLGGG